MALPAALAQGLRLSAGAGGQTGWVNGFSFVREQFGGCGKGVRAPPRRRVDVCSAGHTVPAVDAVRPVAERVDLVAAECAAACRPSAERARQPAHAPRGDGGAQRPV